MPEADAAVAAIAAFASSASPEALPPGLLAGYRNCFVEATAALLSTAGESSLRGVVAAAQGAIGPSAASKDSASPMLDAFSIGCRLGSTRLRPLDPRVEPVGIVALAGALAGALTTPGGLTGSELLLAAAVGTEVQLRLSRRVAASEGDVWRLDQLLTTFGTAVAAGRARGLDAARMESTVGIALTLASGTRQSLATGAPLAYLGNGFSALSGVWAAVQAAHGVGARYAALLGPFGLLPLWFGLEDMGDCLDGLGRDFLSIELVGGAGPPAFERLRSAAPLLQQSLLYELADELDHLEERAEIETLRGLLARALG